MKIGIIGEKKSVLGFKALGLEAFSVDDLDKINLDDFAVLFITEDIDKQKVDFLFKRTMPAVLTVPGLKPSSKRSDLKLILERALGSDMINI